MGKTAIDAKRGNMFMMDPEEIVIIGLDTDDGPEHPLYDERVKLALRPDRVLNFKTFGVLQPVSVRIDGDKVEATAGRQRIRYAREANILLRAEGAAEMRVPVVVKRGDAAYHFGVAVSENEHREDDGLLIKAAKLQRYLTLGRTEREAAVTFGVSLATIKNWQKLLDLDGSVRKLVEGGKLSPSSAAELSKLPREQQREQASKLVEAGTTSTAQAARVARTTKTGGTPEVSKVPKRKVLSRLVELTQDAVGEPVLPMEFVRGIRFAIGELNANTVRGLTELLKEAQPKSRKNDVIDAEFES